MDRIIEIGVSDLALGVILAKFRFGRLTAAKTAVAPHSKDFFEALSRFQNSRSRNVLARYRISQY